MLAFIGSYGESIGIYQIDDTRGTWTHLGESPHIKQPSFLAMHPTLSVLYAVSETNDGTLVAYAYDAATHKLRQIDARPTNGAAPCYVSVHPNGTLVMVANYMGGNVCVVPLMANGTFGAQTQYIQHHGKSVNAARQEAAHAHMIAPDPRGEFALAVDLGLDQVIAYRATQMPFSMSQVTQTRAGSGPRHFAFHANGRWCYLIHELNNTIAAYDYDATSGALHEKQIISTLPRDFRGESYCADIHIHPNGKYVYGSNRGHDSLAIYRVNENDGTLTLIDIQSTRGKWPRNFAIHPSGKWLSVANQHTNNIVTFALDDASGKLGAVVQELSTPSPVCVCLR